jgi:hypothetical protein
MSTLQEQTNATGDSDTDKWSVTLDVTAGPHQGQSFTFAGHDTFIVGRASRAHFRLAEKDQFISRFHFMVEINPPLCRLIDMGSRNGTKVNGEVVKGADLKDGDEIEVGRTRLTVAVRQGPLPVAEPATAPPAPLTVPPPTPPLIKAICRVCAAELPVAETGPLCPACQTQVKRRPQPIPGYQLVREVGEGGMGVVSLALRSADNILVAIKTITPAVAGSPQQVERFLREASILRELDHPHIVAFRDLGEAAGRLFFAMDYVAGTDASRFLQQQGPLPLGLAVGLVCQLLDALDYAHARGFVHRDIKPANLLLAEQGGQQVVKLADFGLAKVYQASQLSGLTMQGSWAGTLPFIAPEQITSFRESKPAVDQYAAAATLYNLLTDCFIYDFPPAIAKRVLMVLQENPVPLRQRRPELPAKVEAILQKALAREPAQRFADVRQFREALRPFGA